MREKILVNLLKHSKEPVNLKDICHHMDLSESTIRNLIRDIKLTSKKEGFSISLIRGNGYILEITDQELFDKIHNDESATIDFFDVNQRIKLILFHLLQTNSYITMDELMEHVLVSRTTLSSDLDIVKKKLQNFNLDLETRPHYGLKVTGREQDLRKAFSEYVLHSAFYVEATEKYRNFFDNVNTEKLERYFRSLLIVHRLSVSEIALNNLVTHFKIMVFRVKEENFIKADQLVMKQIDDVYVEISNKLAEWLYEEYKLVLPKEETQYLAAHISAKTSSDEMNPERRETLYKNLEAILSTLDEEFKTNFYHDNTLIENLLLHMYPLLDRLYYNLQLENPLLDEMKVSYSNVLVVAFRFGELIEEKYKFKLTRDEVGYIAFHLAAHFEREKQNTIDKIKRIIVVCSTGGGNAHMIRMKLENIFPHAIIVTLSNRNMIGFEEDLPDLILTTVPIEHQFIDVPIIPIKNMIDNNELNRIVDEAAYYLQTEPSDRPNGKLQSLFSKEYFQVLEDGEYIDIITNQANTMIDTGVAADNFTELVLERENRYSTIYENGVAGPHPILLNALEDTIGVTILKNPIEWQGKEVQIIFLINLKIGHLFLHKEISKFLMHIMDNPRIKNQLTKVTTYNHFLRIIEQHFQ